MHQRKQKWLLLQQSLWTGFFDVNCIDYLQKGRTITGDYYASLLNPLNEMLADSSAIATIKLFLFLEFEKNYEKSF